MGSMTTPTNATAPRYPLLRPDALTPEAHHLYALLNSRGPSAAAKRFAHQHPEHAAELTAAGLAVTGWTGELEKVVVSTHYTRAAGAGDVLVVVREADLNNPGHRGALVAVIEGATTMLRRDRTVPELTIRARHATATDADHSSSGLFAADVVLPQLLEARDATTLWGGTITELHAYPAGTDPLTVDDGDTRPGTCEHCENAHPFAPYLPPRTYTGPLLVTVEISPLPHR